MKRIVRARLEGAFDRRYEKKLQSRKTDYASFLAGEADGREPADKKEAFSRIRLLTFGNGSPAERAEEKIGRYFTEHPQTLFLYGDEDVEGEDGVFGNPWLKPDWSPDSYLCRDYLGSLVAVREELFEKLSDGERKEQGACHDRLVELAGGFERGCGAIGHLSEILFHRKDGWPLPGEDAGSFLGQAPALGNALVSVIIPSKDNPSVLGRCLETLLETALEVPYEVILADNGSSGENRALVEAEIERIRKKAAEEDRKCFRGLKYLYKEAEFNFSAMCNGGAGEAGGDLLLFLNDDIEAVSPGWMGRMAQKALEPWAGAAGIKLLYPDGERIQHAGVVNIGLGPMHKLQFLKDAVCHYDGRNRGVWNVLAVTAACMMIRKDVFFEAGGFAEELKVAFNDVDLCFTLFEKGFHNVQINTGYLLHHESLSRGSDETDEKQKRLMREWTLLYERHPGLKGKDPYYHRWLCGQKMDNHILPAFEEGIVIPDVRGFRRAENPDRARRDDCVRLALEHVTPDELQGYAVVLGSDNACYKKELLLQKKEDGIMYRMGFTGQYRRDLIENMPDQRNVGLCGFKVRFADRLPAGEYRVGVLARDRISGAELVNYSARNLYVY